MSETLTIRQEVNEESAVLCLEGRVDTITAPELETAIQEIIEGITDMVIDLAEMDYISSAGLRVLLSAQKKMSKQGSLVIRNVRPEVMEIFEITGFTDILTIE